jgi:hypothetical protein
MEHRESEVSIYHTCGTRTDTTPTTPTTGLTNGVTSVAISGTTTALTWTAGDVFTIAGVYAVNEETKQVYSHLQQFSVVSAATAATSSATLYISPIPYYSGAKQNISIVTSSPSAVLVNLSAGGSGAASTTYNNSLAYHKDAFTFVTADLELPKGVDFAAREVYDGISLRVVRNYDIVNDKFPCRIDVLFGYKCTRPQWAARIGS